MILIQFSRVLNRSVAIQNARWFSYKAIKRPNLNSSANKAYVEKKMQEFDLAKSLKTKILLSGPITGNFFI